MNVKEAQMRINASNNFGAGVEDQLEGALKAAHEQSGAADALQQSARKVPNDLIAALQGEKNKEIEEGMSAHAVEKLITKWLTRVGDFLMHLSGEERKKSIAQYGRVDGLREAMNVIQKIRDKDTHNLQKFLEVNADDDGRLASAPVADKPRTAGELAREEHGTLEDRRRESVAEPKTKRKKAVRKKVAKKKVAKKS